MAKAVFCRPRAFLAPWTGRFSNGVRLGVARRVGRMGRTRLPDSDGPRGDGPSGNGGGENRALPTLRGTAADPPRIGG